MTSVSEVEGKMAPDVDQLLAEREGVGEIAVVGDGEPARIDVRIERLHVLERRLAGRRVAVVTDRHIALEAVDDAGLVEVVADEAEATLGVELGAVIGDDAGRLLAAVLERVQAERGQGRGIGVPKNTEDPAFLAESIVTHLGKPEIESLFTVVEPVRHGCLPLKHPPLDDFTQYKARQPSIRIRARAASHVTYI